MDGSWPIQIRRRPYAPGAPLRQTVVSSCSWLLLVRCLSPGDSWHSPSPAAVRRTARAPRRRPPRAAQLELPDAAAHMPGREPRRR
uniref:Uncharacterized protein n=1 Tax=Setaria italica TaxID=4555 RepID=K3ZKM2_SETIT